MVTTDKIVIRKSQKDDLGDIFLMLKVCIK
jgi:hypothetical protein